MVVVNARLMTTADYFETPETNRHEELEFGLLVREAAVSGWHQGTVSWIMLKLFEHVRGRGLGEVRPAPCDVLLDEAKGLVLQPDVLVLLGERVELLGDKIFGAPDLVVEVASPSTRRRDRTRKVVWYRSYGVRECWLVDENPESVTVHYFASDPEPKPRTFTGSDRFESRVLPEFTPLVSELFDPMSRGLGGLRSREAARAHWQARRAQAANGG